MTDVHCVQHTQGYGFDLTFTFEKNDYFTNETLKKTFIMTKQNVIEKCEGTEIAWKDGKDVTKKKVKKKSKSKKAGAKTVTKTVEQESFFNFFKTITMPDEKELAEGKEGDEEEEEKDVGQLMDEDFEIGCEFKDQLVPLALEFYLEVIEDEEGDGDSCCDEEGVCHANDDDSDEDKHKKKKAGKKGGAAGGAAGQQECK